MPYGTRDPGQVAAELVLGGQPYGVFVAFEPLTDGNLADAGEKRPTAANDGR